MERAKARRQIINNIFSQSITKKNMLTEALIKANPTLANLTPEQIAAITTLSQNDENQVIASKYGELYGQFDEIVKEITGEAKPQGKKTTEWVKENFSTLKTKADKAGDTTELETLKTELAKAKEDLKNNAGDKNLKADVERLTKEITDEKQRVKELREAAAKTQSEWEEKVKAEQGKLISLRIDNEANAALAGMKFKDEKLIPANLRQIAIEAAKTKILAEGKADWIDDGKGGQRLVFRDANGQVRNNPENALNPFTFGELLSKELTAVLDGGHKQTGAGTKSDQGGGSGGGTFNFDVNGAKSIVEADELFTRAWLAQGKPKSDPEYNTKWQEMRKSLPADLPMQ